MAAALKCLHQSLLCAMCKNQQGKLKGCHALCTPHMMHSMQDKANSCIVGTIVVTWHRMHRHAVHPQMCKHNTIVLSSLAITYLPVEHRCVTWNILPVQLLEHIIRHILQGLHNMLVVMLPQLLHQRLPSSFAPSGTTDLDEVSNMRHSSKLLVNLVTGSIPNHGGKTTVWGRGTCIAGWGGGGCIALLMQRQ